MTLATAHVRPVEKTEPDVAQERPYRMSLELYDKIVELALIRPEEHVVLLDGILVQTMTQGSPHYNAVDRGRESLSAALPNGWYVRAGGPVKLQTGPLGVSVPEPDLAVVLGWRASYETRPPEVSEIGLIVEIASDGDAFLTDRKGLVRYAHAGIPTVWIVTLDDRQVHVYTEPSDPTASPGYAQVEVKPWGASLEATLLPFQADRPPEPLGPIAVASFFPPAP